MTRTPKVIHLNQHPTNQHYKLHKTMITIEEIRNLPYMIDVEDFEKMRIYKSFFQTEILKLLTDEERKNISNSIEDKGVIDKLTFLANAAYNQYANNRHLYCLSMVIGTILKEYGWGTKYIEPEGLYYLAKEITGEISDEESYDNIPDNPIDKPDFKKAFWGDLSGNIERKKIKVGRRLTESDLLNECMHYAWDILLHFENQLGDKVSDDWIKHIATQVVDVVSEHYFIDKKNQERCKRVIFSEMRNTSDVRTLKNKVDIYYNRPITR